MRILKDKVELLKERQVLKKMSTRDISDLIEEIDLKIREHYFEVKTEDIARQYQEKGTM